MLHSAAFFKNKMFESFHIKEQFLSSDKFYTYFLSQSQFKHSSIHYKHTARNLRKQTECKVKEGEKNAPFNRQTVLI